MGDHGGFRRHHRRYADRGNEDEGRDPRDIAEIARLQQRVRDLELQREDRFEVIETDNDIGDDEGGIENPFARGTRRRRPVESDPLLDMGVKIEVP